MITLTKEQQRYVDLALELHPAREDNSDMLTMIEFIEVTKFNISRLYIDKFWASLHDGQLIYIDDDLLKWMGFDAMRSHDRKRCFVDLLKSNDIVYIEYNNEEYINKVTQVNDCMTIYPPAATGKGAGKIKHILLDTYSLKCAVMLIGKGIGRRAKEHYLQLEKLLKIYMNYQLQVKDMQLARETERLTVLKQELDISKQELTTSKITLSVTNQKLKNTRMVSDELLSYKLTLERNQTVYIITSELYAAQGYYKVGKCKSLSAKGRLTTMNIGHVPGDDLYIAAEFKTNNARILEDRAHALMHESRIQNNREWFHLPYKTIYLILDTLRENINKEQDEMNEITRMLHDASCTDPSKIKWNEGMSYMNNV